MFEHPRRGRQARNFTTNLPKILDLKSFSEQIFSKNCRWVPLVYGTVDPRSTDTRITYITNGQFCLPRLKAHTFSIKLTHFIRTRLIRAASFSPCPESKTLISRQPRVTETSYLCTAYFHFHNHELIVEIVQ